MLWSIDTHMACRMVSQYKRGASLKEIGIEHKRHPIIVGRLITYYAEFGEIPIEGTLPRRSQNVENLVSDIDKELHLVN